MFKMRALKNTKVRGNFYKIGQTIEVESEADFKLLAIRGIAKAIDGNKVVFDSLLKKSVVKKVNESETETETEQKNENKEIKKK